MQKHGYAHWFPHPQPLAILEKPRTLDTGHLLLPSLLLQLEWNHRGLGPGRERRPTESSRGNVDCPPIHRDKDKPFSP